MGKILFINGPAHGHTNPTLGLVEELTLRGEKVVYITTEEFRERIEKKGAEVKTYKDFTKDLNPGKNVNIFDMVSYLTILAKSIIPDILEKIKGEEFDIVVHDSMFGFGKQISEILKIPSVCTCTTFAPSKTFIKTLTKSNNLNIVTSLLTGIPGLIVAKKNSWYLSRKYKIKYPGIFQSFFSKGDLNLVFTSKYFQPDSDFIDDSFKFVGPSITYRDEELDFPFNDLKGHKAIFISMGTIFNNTLDFYRKCFDAFRYENVKVVLSVGNRVPISLIGQTPENFIIKKYVPQLQLLKYVDVFITHGGMNSTSEALYNNIPLIVIPQYADQPVVAARVGELGAGIVLNKDNISSQALKEALNDILNNPSFSESSRKIGESLRNSGGAKKAVDEILSLRNSNK
ncbi:MAG: macrolide family glycosyltransferase [Clostridiaceae bacterium]